MSPQLTLPTRTEAEARADRDRKRVLDRLWRLKNDPTFFDDGLGDVFTRDQFERSMKS